MSNIVQIEFNNLCGNCKHMGVQYCKDSHCEVEPFCKLSGIERKLCVSENCPLTYREAKHDADLLDKVMQKHRTIIDDDGVMYKVVFLKDIEDMKAEVSK